MRLQLAHLALAIAAVATVTHPARAADGDGWKLSADTLVYGDTDNVVVISPQVAVEHALDDDGGAASARVVVDTVSAASVDVVSQASKGFSETRLEADLAASLRLGAYLTSLSYRGSHESDYDSHGLGVGVSRRLGGADTTLALDYGIALDTVGYTGTPPDAFARSLISQDVSVTLTQVLGPKTVVRGVYTLSDQVGYMEKPYRFVPLFSSDGIDAAARDRVTLDLWSFDRYRLALRPAEEVPDLRVGHAFGVRALRYLEGLPGSVRADLQLFVDSWGVKAVTVEPTLSWRVIDALTASVYARGYAQSGARFWRRTYVVDGPDTVPRWRTIDRDLSPYRAVSGGLRAEWTTSRLAGYVDASAMQTVYDDYLYLHLRGALVVQAGLRLEL